MRTTGLAAALTLALLCTSLIAAGCADPSADPASSNDDGEQPTENDVIGAFPVGQELRVTGNVNHRDAPSMQSKVLQVIPNGTTVLSGAAKPSAGFYGVTWNGKTGWVSGKFIVGASAATGAAAISETGRKQMKAIVAYGDAHNGGASRGRCFEFVWRYLTNSTYGQLNDFNDAADMRSGEARNFAEYFNVKANADLWGLQRLSITNPYDAPVGSVVVVAAGSPGTSHPTAGDITIAAGGGRFINDGPQMSYGPKASFLADGGKVLGVFVPK